MYDYYHLVISIQPLILNCSYTTVFDLHKNNSEGTEELCQISISDHRKPNSCTGEQQWTDRDQYWMLNQKSFILYNNGHAYVYLINICTRQNAWLCTYNYDTLQCTMYIIIATLLCIIVWCVISDWSVQQLIPYHIRSLTSCDYLSSNCTLSMTTYCFRITPRLIKLQRTSSHD